MSILKLSKELELLLGSLGAFQSLFLAFYIFIGKKRNITNMLLGSFFVLITLRVLKSLLWVYLDQVPDWLINMGFAAHLASGPMLLLYFQYILFPKPWNRLNFLHFIPVLGLLPFLFSLNEANFWYLGGYSFLLYHQMGYTLVSILLLGYAYFKKVPLASKRWIWLIILLIGATGIQWAYFSNYVLGLTPYMAGPLVYGFFICIIALYGLIHQEVFESTDPPHKYQNIQIDPSDFDHARSSILQAMEKDKPYLDEAFTLAKLSKHIKLPPYLTSHVINKGFSTNFPDFINGYRIKEARSKLISPAYRKMKIAQVAYDCGFNSLSAFNAAFKKNTGTTPSSYRKTHGRS